MAQEVKSKIEEVIDEKLATKGLSISEIKSVVDINQDGKITKEDIQASLKDFAQDTLVIEQDSTS